MDESLPAVDPALGFLVETANRRLLREDAGFGVTLALDGMLVSGELIPNWQWHEETAAQLSEASVRAGQDPEGGYVRLFRVLAEVSEQERDQRQEREDERTTDTEDDQEADDGPTFVHLRSARFFSPGSGPLPAAGMHWRGRLSQVAGWSVGVLGASDGAA